LTDAARLGPLVVFLATDAYYLQYKKELRAVPYEHTKAVLESLKMVSEVRPMDDLRPDSFGEPDITGLNVKAFYVNCDAWRHEQRRAWCIDKGIYLYVEDKPLFDGSSGISSTAIKARVHPQDIPLRIDFGGGDLIGKDVVCRRITSGVTVRLFSCDNLNREPPYIYGLGGSTREDILAGKDPLEVDRSYNNSWQDSFFLHETGCCVFEDKGDPGKFMPRDTLLIGKNSGDWLEGRMLVLDCGPHTDRGGNYLDEQLYNLREGALKCASACMAKNLQDLIAGTALISERQEAMCQPPIPRLPWAKSKWYAGAAFGGAGCYLFETQRDRLNCVEEARKYPHIIKRLYYADPCVRVPGWNRTRNTLNVFTAFPWSSSVTPTAS
jgi:glycerol-3-phosphate cytidylyltransferase-like family protein